MTPDTPPEAAAARVEVCDKHGLRYNAAVEEGCARCRTEAAGRAMGGTGFVARRPTDLGRSLIVAVVLVVGVGLSLYGAHSLAYGLGRSVLEQSLDETWEEAPETEEDLEAVFEEILGDN